jgi:hypothetical protein
MFRVFILIPSPTPSSLAVLIVPGECCESGIASQFIVAGEGEETVRAGRAVLNRKGDAVLLRPLAGEKEGQGVAEFLPMNRETQASSSYQPEHGARMPREPSGKMPDPQIVSGLASRFRGSLCESLFGSILSPVIIILGRAVFLI